LRCLHFVLGEEVVIHNLVVVEEEEGVETKWGEQEQGNWREGESVQEMNPVLACD